jgi:DNA-binding ferritin-like protein (Dps family)
MDSKANNIMDINSLMTAFENYVTAIKAKEDVVGTPVNFYLKKLTAQNIAKLWVSKYFPENAPKDEV